MSSFSKKWIRVVLSLAALACVEKGHAIALQGLYTAACQREIGTVLEINSQAVRLLSIEGKLIDVPKYEIIYMAEYPLDRLPRAMRVDLGSVPQFVFRTLKGRDLVELARGWPVEFSEEKISVLSSEGTESLVDKRSIWTVEQRRSGTVSFETSVNANQIDFVHPYVFRDCVSGGQKSVKVFPQQILSDPVLIKKELDRLQKGFQLLSRYEREQDFYPIPEVYKNFTSLGLWQNFGSRYGSSKKRSNNFTPFLTDQISTDVFDFQRIIQTGSGPIPNGIHEEPQMHGYYAFKASYFHFSIMMDPSILIVGSNNYQWAGEDFSVVDDKLHQAFGAEFGFDFGPWSFMIPLGTSVPFGFFDGQRTTVGTLPVGFTGVQYRKPTYRWLFLFGAPIEAASSEDRSTASGSLPGNATLGVFRGEFETFFSSRWKVRLILINRNFRFAEKTDGITGISNEQYKSTSNTLAGYVDYQLSHRFTISSYLSLESKRNNLDVVTETATVRTTSSSNVYPKLGTSLHLSF